MTVDKFPYQAVSQGVPVTFRDLRSPREFWESQTVPGTLMGLVRPFKGLIRPFKGPYKALSRLIRPFKEPYKAL